jgi:hypothetical protein
MESLADQNHRAPWTGAQNDFCEFEEALPRYLSLKDLREHVLACLEQAVLACLEQAIEVNKIAFS